MKFSINEDILLSSIIPSSVGIAAET